MITTWHINSAVSLQNLIAQVSEITTDEIIITDKEQTILYVNPAFSIITGYSANEVLGKKPSVLKSGKHSRQFYDKMWKVLNQGEVFKQIMINKAKSGKLIYEEKVIVPIKDAEGAIQHYVSTGRDVTQRLELQKGLKRQSIRLNKANKDLETFIYKAAHDIRGPLASIIGVANMFHKEIRDKKALIYCGYIKECAQNLDEILKNMTHFQVLNGSDLVVKKINFEKLIDRVLSSFSYYEGFAEAEINVSIKMKADFFSDENSLVSIFQNLIHNAVKFRKSGEQAVIVIGVETYRKGIKISIRDNGIGIKKQCIDKLCEMFYRANSTHKGSGLGLFFVKQMICNLHGKIDFFSDKQSGTTVTVALPNSEKRATALT